MGPVAVGNGRVRTRRVQDNIIAALEKRCLLWLCARLPAFVTPDHLTVAGVAGAGLVFAAEIASRGAPLFFWVASFGLAVNWFGDSLDGNLARFRGIERPVYGYFLDHTVDVLNNFMIMAGFGLTLYVRMDAALFALTGYYCLCMYVFINNHVSGVFQLSFLWLGPTELRIFLAAINTAMFFFGRAGFTAAGTFFSWYDAVLIFGGAILIAIYVVRVAAGIAHYRDAARSGQRPPQA